MDRFTAHHRILFTVFLFILFTFYGRAQEAILSASNNATGTGGTVNYSVGQPVFHTVDGTSGTITEGVQQPYEILFMTGLEDKNKIALDCIVYPNPASSEVKLKIEQPIGEQFICRLTTLAGAVIREMKIENRETTIPMNELKPGIYIVTLLENNTDLATWKVIKK